MKQKRKGRINQVKEDYKKNLLYLMEWAIFIERLLQAECGDSKDTTYKEDFFV